MNLAKSSGTPLPSVEWLMPRRSDSSTLTVACIPSDFSASQIARAVEDCDAHLVNLNVTDQLTPEGLTIIHLRVTHSDPTSVARSLSRYGYETIDASVDYEIDDDEARQRALEVAHYLSLGSEL